MTIPRLPLPVRAAVDHLPRTAAEAKEFVRERNESNRKRHAAEDRAAKARTAQLQRDVELARAMRPSRRDARVAQTSITAAAIYAERNRPRGTSDATPSAPPTFGEIAEQAYSPRPGNAAGLIRTSARGEA